MVKNKKLQPNKRILYVLFAIIIILMVALLFALMKQNQTDSKAINVDLGTYEYDIKDGKATKLTDINVTSLNNFLTKAAENDISSNCKEVYYWVTAYSADKNQVLLSYGCEHPGSKTFAVWESGAWKFIPSTNQFDMLGIPLCNYVDENNINKSIAPVCFNKTDNTDNPVVYQVR